MRLYIAEKPSMARELAACLKNPQKNNGFIHTDNGIVTWLFGHVLQQVEPAAYDPKYKNWRAEDLPIVPKVWKLEVNPEAANQFRIVKGLIKNADEIVHAGDPDREGQLLVDEVLDFLGNTKPVKRILLNALDEMSIIRANNDLRDNDDFFNLKQSALARSRADWLIGMNLSRAYTLAARRYGYSDLVLPIGRVKTPTLALVVRREREIEKFRPVHFYVLRAFFKHDGKIFSTKWVPSKKTLKLPAFDKDGHLLDRDFAEKLASKFSVEPCEGKVSSCKATEKIENPPLPFSLSRLQVESGKLFGYTPQQVLDAAQKLYEKKLTTYPRSDCEYLPTSQFKDASRILAHLTGTDNRTLKLLLRDASANIRSRAWNDKKISAHHAIIPTTKPLNMELPEVESNVYNMIARNYTFQFYTQYIYDEIVATIKYKDENFVVRGKSVKMLGWRKNFTITNPKEDDESETPLPKMKSGDEVTYTRFEIKNRSTKPPVRFSASSLVQGMKNIHNYVKNPESKKQLKDVYGIGTEATRAAIIDDLIKRDFLKVEHKKLYPTEKAYLLIDALPDEMTYPDATAIWEDKLHSMSEGDGTLEDFLAGQVKFTSELCEAAHNAKFAEAEGVFKCPNCGSALNLRQGKNGLFWSCSNYPECKAAFDDDNGKPDFDGKARSARLFKAGAPKCPNCGNALVKKNGKFGVFWGCSAYPKCRTTFNDRNGKPDFDGKKFLRANNFNAPTDFNPADFEPIISSADFR